MKKNTEALLDSGKGDGLKVNAEETKYRVISRHQNAGQSYNVTIANKSFQSMAKFKYFGLTVINEDCIHENKIKSRLN
jgi:hypothetical protein